MQLGYLRGLTIDGGYPLRIERKSGHRIVNKSVYCPRAGQVVEPNWRSSFHTRRFREHPIADKCRA
jgi:hypothetical protein